MTLPALSRWSALGLAALLCGCAGYQLGPTGGQSAGARSVEIVPFLNDTLEPRLTDDLTGGLRKEFQRDGTFRLQTHGEADVVVTGKVTSYNRRALSLAPTDLATGRDYRLEMTAQVIARERGTGKVLLDQPVMGSTLIRVANDLTSTERQALPLLANDLAKRVVALLAEGGW